MFGRGRRRTVRINPSANRLTDNTHKPAGSEPVEGTTGATLNWEQLEKHRRDVLEQRGKMAFNTDKGVKIDIMFFPDLFLSQRSCQRLDGAQSAIAGSVTPRALGALPNSPTC
jgi:hypothetical protein